MKLQQEANRKILELADKAQTEAIRLSLICVMLHRCHAGHKMKFAEDLHYNYRVKILNYKLMYSNS